MNKVIHAVFSDGERYPMFLGDDGLPDFWITLFITANKRKSHSASAIESIIRHLMHLKLWEEIHERNLLREIADAKFPSDDDIYSIRDHCLLDTRSLRKSMMSDLPDNVSRLAPVYPVARRTIDVVKKAQYSMRLFHIADYLYFSTTVLLRNRQDVRELWNQVDGMKKRILAQRIKVPKHNGRSDEPDLKAPAPEVFEKFMDIINEHHPDNPFKNPAIRLRNALMFEVMYVTGFRAGEVLGLNIEDVDFQGNSISVVRRHDNPHDPRSRQPVAKTLERTIRVPPALISRLHDYIMKVRAIIPGSSSHPFIFITHKNGEHCGKPISDTSFRNRILKPATETFLELFEEISRHGFRHNYNYTLSQRIDAHNRSVLADPASAKKQGKSIINEKQEIQIRKRLNGWSSDHTAETYNKRFIKEQSDKLMIEDMQDQAKHIWTEE